MSDDELRVASYIYDTTRALFDGTPSLEDGIPLRMWTGPTLPHVFRRVLDGEADAGELGLTFYLRALEAGDDRFVAIPAFPNRVFRHSSVFINTGSDIHGPRDLVGRTIGEFGIYGQDCGVWAKGILSDEYGFAPERNRWVIGGLDAPAKPFTFTTHPHPEGLDITTVEDRGLGAMLEDGEIDALFTANVPQVFLDGSSHVARLFPDYERVERDWFRRTRMFPIMHAVVVRRDVIARRPGIESMIYRAFLEAKEAGLEQYRQARRLFLATTALPWADALVEDDMALMGDDWWPYGISANRAELETNFRYENEQGITSRLWTVEELFAPDVLST